MQTRTAQTRTAQPRHARPGIRASAATAGVAAVLLGIGIGTLTAALFVPASSPCPSSAAY